MQPLGEESSGWPTGQAFVMWQEELKEKNRPTENTVDIGKGAGQEIHANIFR